MIIIQILYAKVNNTVRFQVLRLICKDQPFSVTSNTLCNFIAIYKVGQVSAVSLLYPICQIFNAQIQLNQSKTIIVTKYITVYLTANNKISVRFKRTLIFLLAVR